MAVIPGEYKIWGMGIYHYPLPIPEEGGPCGERKKKRPLHSDLFLEGSAVTDRFNGTAPLCKPEVGYHTHSRRNNAP